MVIGAEIERADCTGLLNGIEPCMELNVLCASAGTSRAKQVVMGTRPFGDREVLGCASLQ